MAADVLDQLQENKLRGLEELLDSGYSAATLGGGEDEAAVVADFLVDEGMGLRQALLRFWDYYWTAALTGKVTDRQKLGAKIRSLLERGASLLSRGVAAARNYADLSGHEVTRLAQFEEQAKEFPLWVEECIAKWELLDRPRKPLNRERIAKSREAFKRGECELVPDIIDRLEKGEPLAPE